MVGVVMREEFRVPDVKLPYYLDGRHGKMSPDMIRRDDLKQLATTK
jgi:hypothetical protein